MLTKRINVFFEEKKWTKLKKQAKQQHRSASNLIREAVDEKYLSQESINRSRAFSSVLFILFQARAARCPRRTQRAFARRKQF